MFGVDVVVGCYDNTSNNWRWVCLVTVVVEFVVVGNGFELLLLLLKLKVERS